MFVYYSQEYKADAETHIEKREANSQLSLRKTRLVPILSIHMFL